MAKENLSYEVFVMKELGSRNNGEVVERNSDSSDSSDSNQNDLAFFPESVNKKGSEIYGR